MGGRWGEDGAHGDATVFEVQRSHGRGGQPLVGDGRHHVVAGASFCVPRLASLPCRAGVITCNQSANRGRLSAARRAPQPLPVA